MAIVDKAILTLILRHKDCLPDDSKKQLSILNEWANVVHRSFLAIFQAETDVEIRPCSSPIALDHILEFEDGTEVYDVAASSLS